jgi:hypothetical protein
VRRFARPLSTPDGKRPGLLLLLSDTCRTANPKQGLKPRLVVWHNSVGQKPISRITGIVILLIIFHNQFYFSLIFRAKEKYHDEEIRMPACCVSCGMSFG